MWEVVIKKHKWQEGWDEQTGKGFGAVDALTIAECWHAA